MSMGRRIFLTLIVTLACAVPASAARVTSVTVSPTHIVGGTTQQATATISVAFESGENINAPYEWYSYHIYSVYVAVDDANAWGAGYFYCGGYVPIGSNSVTCQMPSHWAVPTSQTVTLLARAGNINYRDSPYNNDPGVTTTFTVDPAPPPGGTLRVTTNLAAASFTISGPATYSGSGTSFTKFNAPAGSYTVAFAPVASYQTPSPQTRTLPSGGSITFAASYQPERTLRLRAGLGEDVPGPGAGVTLPTEARVPLGAVLHLETVDQAGQALPASFVLNTASLAADVAPTALFSDATLVRFTGAPINGAIYQSVHRGTVTITIMPSDSALPPGTLTVIVEDPLRLGSAANDVDADVYKVAHRYGVPPQFIKAHGHKESGARFDRLAYRYEPIGPWVGDLLAVSRSANLRTASPYGDYRLATEADSSDQALDAGALMSADDRDVRNGLTVECADNRTGGRTLTADDSLVSAWEIFRCNDRRMNWSKVAGKAGPSRAKALEDDPFTAQTGLASSFGILQITYVTAIQDMKWAGDKDGARNPSLLLDSVENHARKAGSLDVGTKKVVKDLKNAADASGIDTFDKLLEDFVKAWNRYNAGEKGYGDSVAQKVPLYPPIARAAVLGGV
jgi:hypothetical protein